jgi:hypothetical protein
MAPEALLVTLCVRGWGPFLFRHGSRWKVKQCSLSPKNLPFLSLSLTHSVFMGKEKDEKAMTDCVRGHKGAQG